jgi:serine/threonine protein kinase
MGTVWLCTDEMLGREVAVKQVGLFFGESATDTARALREARNTAALSHPHVVSVFDVAEDGADVWLVMEHVPSRTLADIIEAEGRLEPLRAVRIGAQVADGLAAAHARDMIHRDVKPSNILVTEGDHAKIGDFGIARGRDDPQLTQTGLVTGTPSYFSPELARGDDPGPETDVWALGATLYAAVEGRPAYLDKGNALAVLQTIAHEPTPPAEHAGVLAEPLARMMDRDPATRWTMADAAQVLRKLADQPVAWDTGTSALPAPEPPEQTTSTAAVPPADPTRPPNGRSRVPAVVAMVAAVLLIAAGAVGVTLLGDGDEPAATPPGPGPASPTAEGPPSESAASPSAPTDDAEPSPPADTTAPPETTAPAPDPPATRGRFVDGYFDTVPHDLDAGWQLLSPRMQAEVGRESFDSFWGQMADVDAASIRSGQDAVDATVTYTYDSGRVVRQQNQYELVRTADGFLIDDETVISSTTVSQ